jgi:3-deoxy-D-manno-octulosonate 8-phosphate phosphatase KdsC-like HAD superfamily phosphatase
MEDGRGKMEDVIQRKAEKIKMLITDCDGVLTDGGVYYGENGEGDEEV